MACFIAFFLLAQDHGVKEFRISCGASALHMLLNLNEQRHELEEVETHLPASDEGNSLQELVESARRFGVYLRGCRLNTESVRPQQPFIALLKPTFGRNGHYVVVKPIHKTDSVQILDIQTYPKVVSWNDLFSAVVWDGVALVQEPRPKPWMAPFLIGGIVFGLALIVAAFFFRRPRM